MIYKNLYLIKTENYNSSCNFLLNISIKLKNKLEKLKVKPLAFLQLALHQFKNQHLNFYFLKCLEIKFIC